MCPPKVDKPKIEVPEPDPRIADEQLALSQRIAEETRRKRLAAFSDSIATSSRGVLARADTTRSFATGGS